MAELFQDRRAKGRGSEKTDASLSTLVSIYLLILAFLVTMYSVSSAELSKAAVTMNAVQDAFHGKRSYKPQAPLEYEVNPESVDDQFASRGGVRPFHEQGARLVLSSFSLEGGINVREGQGLIIEIPANRIFIGVSHLPRPEFEVFAQEVAGLIDAAGSRELREVEFIFSINKNNKSASTDKLAQGRLDSLAQNLIEQGVLPENIILGMREGDNSFVSIGFYSRIKNGSELNFADMKGN